MMMRIVQLGDPILRETSIELTPEQIMGNDIQQLLLRMKETLNGIQSISSENGNALSAPQAGTAVRMILLRIDGVFTPMINPVITNFSDETFEFDEECFSFYNLRAKVTRHQTIVVEFFDEFAQKHTQTLNGEMAGLVQHEVDHLNGIFFLDRVEGQENLASIDHVYQDAPQKLVKVKEMIDYMVG
jgi:peptide deformylase